MNVIALPNGKPVYCGTYYSKAEWIEVLNKFNDLYNKDPKKMTDYANMVAKGVNEANIIEVNIQTNDFTTSDVSAIVNMEKENWDLKWGGNKAPQKFILPANLEVLLDYAVLSNDQATKDYLKLTLDKILLGGIYDHVGGGFFRYSTDPTWKVPHYEKMLYDNGQLLSLFSKAYRVFKNPAYKKIVFETYNFLEKEMKNPEGCYYSSIDADSEGKEGIYYLWTEKELKTILQNDFPLFAKYYTIAPNQKIEDNQFLFIKTKNDSAFAEHNNISQSTLKEYQVKWRQLLQKQRATRTAVH